MKFRTELQIDQHRFIGHGKPILTLGSCFAEHIGQKMLDAKWSGLNSPLGTLFHPCALAKLLRLACDQGNLDTNLFVWHDGAVFHHDLPSRFFAKSAEELSQIWEGVATRVRQLISSEPVVLLTLGTAWVYQQKGGGLSVANCHKQRADLFEKRLLELGEILGALAEILSCLPIKSPLMISLSPVRHIKDSLALNSLSKGLLRYAIHQFEEANSERVIYFPAYEIMMDDLRDYRFYEKDMLHPSSEAIEYIWQKFTQSFCCDASINFLKFWEPIQRALEHRPQRLDSPSYQIYLRRIIASIKEYDQLDFHVELAELRSRLC